MVFKFGRLFGQDYKQVLEYFSMYRRFSYNCTIILVKNFGKSKLKCSVCDQFKGMSCIHPRTPSALAHSKGKFSIQ